MARSNLQFDLIPGSTHTEPSHYSSFSEIPPFGFEKGRHLRMETLRSSSDPISVPGSPPSGMNEVDGSASFAEQLAAAQRGLPAELGEILNSFRNYLLLIANRELGESIQAKIGASDIVQETFLQAEKIVNRFEGSSRQEFAAWLAQILEFKLSQTRRHFAGSQKREVARERSLEPLEEQLFRDLRLPEAESPSACCAQCEEGAAIDAAIRRLPTDYRVEIELRSLQGKTFAEVGQALNRTTDAARMLWGRAVLRLRKELQADRSTKTDLSIPHEQRSLET